MRNQLEIRKILAELYESAYAEGVKSGLKGFKLYRKVDIIKVAEIDLLNTCFKFLGKHQGSCQYEYLFGKQVPKANPTAMYIFKNINQGFSSIHNEYDES